MRMGGGLYLSTQGTRVLGSGERRKKGRKPSSQRGRSPSRWTSLERGVIVAEKKGRGSFCPLTLQRTAREGCSVVIFVEPWLGGLSATKPHRLYCRREGNRETGKKLSDSKMKKQEAGLFYGGGAVNLFRGERGGRGTGLLTHGVA